ncbi:MAG: hypothetical protein ACRD2H_05515 [Terriglobales bacterium]
MRPRDAGAALAAAASAERNRAASYAMTKLLVVRCARQPTAA